LGAEVYGASLDIPTQPSHFQSAGIRKYIKDCRIDLRDTKKIYKLVAEINPDFVFHLAAQSLVRRSFTNPLETFQTNIFGTLNLLEALRPLKKTCIAVLITSDKCYENVEWVWGYRETDTLGGSDPYSASKSAAELVIRSHVKSFFPKGGPICVAVGRAGNVIGGGDWAQDRLVPDCIRSWNEGKTAILRNPNATRPWQHVLEPLSGYLTLAVSLHQNPELHGEPFNFGPPAVKSQSVKELVKEMSNHWPAVKWKNDSMPENNPSESGLLKLNCDKALHYLNWEAVLSFHETVKMTADWYRIYHEKQSAIREVTLNQIREYEDLAKQRKLPWAQ
jgi:CDP-glucose 4,6-dehydratase